VKDVPIPGRLTPEAPCKVALTTTEAAHALGIGRTVLYRHLQLDDGPADPSRIQIVRIGHLVRVPLTSLEAWVARRMQLADHGTDAA
jgi:excisionase family DNA binding protein